MKNLLVIVSFLAMVCLFSGQAVACHDCQDFQMGLVSALSVSGSGAIVGDFYNGAVGGSGAGALSVGVGQRDMKAKAKTKSATLVYLEEGERKNKDFKGMEDWNTSASLTESSAMADVEKRGCRGEVNLVGVVGLTGTVSTIGNMNHGAGALSGGAYLAGAISTDKVVASGSSKSISHTYRGDTGTAQWAGAYSSNVTVSKVDFK